MSHEAMIAIAPVFTHDRFVDPAWAPDRTMYERTALRFMYRKETIPLICNHDDSRPIGTVHSFGVIDWPGGPWVYATATVTNPPPWLERGVKASFRERTFGRRELVVREFRADVITHAFVEEVSVLSPGMSPVEPLAEVLYFRPAKAAAARAAVGEQEIHLPPGTLVRRNCGVITSVTMADGSVMEFEH